ncbi:MULTISPECIES: ArsR/SmtB family transcription factor [Halorussus]|uniref:ArsR/SmtB family transcription factor n=1 Tax=Halorussus TaxID=1070314 RepID=UPI00209D5E02|nr:helix-turn-helix domain-containing protein [Halorussus vallis]USZ78113.1 helix-turn-helix domain-containing protein [Halorussus vallis]
MTDDSLSPDEAFAVLGDETRIAILRSLFERPYEPMTFSELREAVGMADSGQFNYHLNKLVGQFVRKTEEGYELRLAGWQVLGAILSGTYTESGNVEPVEADHPCRRCGGVVVATYEDERMTIRCTDCDEQYSSAGVPPGVLDGFEREELVDRFDRFMRGLVAQARLGVCVSCSGRMDAEVLTDPDPEIGVDVESIPGVVYRCRRCPEVVSASFGSALLDHPEIVAFHWEHGVDLRHVPSWTLAWLTDDHATVESEDPLRVRLVVELGDEAGVEDTKTGGAGGAGGAVLELLIDENLEAVEVTRR